MKVKQVFLTLFFLMFSLQGWAMPSFESSSTAARESVKVESFSARMPKTRQSPEVPKALYVLAVLAALLCLASAIAAGLWITGAVVANSGSLLNSGLLAMLSTLLCGLVFGICVMKIKRLLKKENT